LRPIRLALGLIGLLHVHHFGFFDLRFPDVRKVGNAKPVAGGEDSGRNGGLILLVDGPGHGLLRVVGRPLPSLSSRRGRSLRFLFRIVDLFLQGTGRFLGRAHLYLALNHILRLRNWRSMRRINTLEYMDP